MPYLFDGNSLIGQSAEQMRRDPSARRAFLQLLGREAAAGGGKFTVFFDGDDPDRSLPPRGVRVRYSAPLSCDELISKTVTGAAAPHEITVVTNDRELARRCRDAGARVTDWSGFTTRKRSTARTGAAASDPSRPVDIREWSEFFGVDPDSLE